MKIRPLLAAALAAAATLASATAEVTYLRPGYSESTYYNAGANDIVSFDWSDSGDLYYLGSAAYTYQGLLRWNGTTTTTVVAPTAGTYPGASVISYGGSIYYNTSDSTDQYIHRYDISGSTTTPVSTAPNYFLAGSGGLFITGAVGWGTNHIYYSAIDGSGNLVNDPPLDLGVTVGASGPIVFDLAGNLYYAPGAGSLAIYKWSAAEVAAAIADPSGNPLANHNDRLWADYTGVYSGIGGGTAMALDAEGNILLTLTNWSGPSTLALFEVEDDGTFGETYAVLRSTSRLGEIRFRDGLLYVAAENEIIQVIPEPSSALLLLLGGAGAWVVRRRRRFAAASVALLAAGSVAQAGPYAQSMDDSGNLIDAPIPGWVGSEGDGIVGGENVLNPMFVGWATTVVSYLPSPGVQAGFSDPTRALGPASGDEFDVVSLGDLATGSNPPANGEYGVIGTNAPGSIILGFSQAITNGVGADFAVFENGFISQYTMPGGYVAGQTFAELAYVEVSTNGVDFARFPSISLTPDLVGAYGTIDPTNVYNLAGKSINSDGQSWGTPFNLDDLLTDELVINGVVDLSNILYIRLVDIPGNGAFEDSMGNPIYDAWVTWGTGGFDLDAIGVIHAVPEPSTYGWVAAALGGGMLWRRSSRAA